MITKEIDKLLNEDTGMKENCALCKESSIKVGENTGYGSIIYKLGNSSNGWFATLSPKTGSDPRFDFTIQLMPISHLTHFSQISSHPKLAENFGIAFSKLCKAATTIMMQDQDLKSISEDKASSAPLATYGKTTTWKEKKEHLHIKIFPFRGNIGQPYTVDSSFGRKEVFYDPKTKQEFTKMKPVKKRTIDKKRFNHLKKRLISILKK